MWDDDINRVGADTSSPGELRLLLPTTWNKGLSNAAFNKPSLAVKVFDAAPDLKPTPGDIDLYTPTPDLLL